VAIVAVAVADAVAAKAAVAAVTAGSFFLIE
jgi:hypothetical protein